jgi:hypothetical protein
MSEIHQQRYPEDPQNDGNPNNDHQPPRKKSPEKSDIQDYIHTALQILKQMT